MNPQESDKPDMQESLDPQDWDAMRNLAHRAVDDAMDYWPVELAEPIHADVAAATGLVLHDHRPKRVLHALGQHAGRDVDRTTGAIGDDDADGFSGRGRLGQGQRGRQRQQGEKKVVACHACIVQDARAVAAVLTGAIKGMDRL